MRDMLKPTLTLLAICFVVALGLALVNSFTKNVVAERMKNEAEQQRKAVLAVADNFKALTNWEGQKQEGIVKEVYVAYQGQQFVGYVFSLLPKGYAGDIKITVGVTKAGKIAGVQMGENQETPGLGTKAAEKPFITQYNDKAITHNFTVVTRTPHQDHEIQGISGATITSKAVTNAVQAAADLAKELLAKEGVKK